MLATTTERVELNTQHAINMKIRQDISEKAQYYALQPEMIDDRLTALEGEWDIERTLEANAATGHRPERPDWSSFA